MRTIEKLSPTALHQWERDRQDFYTQRLSENRAKREPQSGAMAVGSAFDAFVKCALYSHIFGNEGESFVDRAGVDTGIPIYNLQRLFEEQVENKEIRPWAWEAGKYAFDCYVTWGNYNELLQELLQSEEDPRFEFSLDCVVGGVPLQGKPDLWYKKVVQVVYDWKVMGFCSKSSQSPKKFYRSCRDCWGLDRGKATRGGGEPKAHKGYKEIDHEGHKIGSHFLSEVDKKWADQITTYAWMLGVPVGDESMVVGLDQLVCKPAPDPEANRMPLIRVAQHRCRISEGWQEGLLKRYQSCWEAIQSGHIFDDMTREESDARCEVLDMEQPESDDLWDMINVREFKG
jgi:hypothetical protein